MEFFLTTVLKLIPFLRVTILIAFTSMALGLIFGTLLAAMKMCRIKMLKTIANLFTTFIRCTPVIVLIFLAYYGLPVLFGLAGIDINGVSKIVFSIIALTMYASGTLSEIIRPAYLSVDKGQMEAALMSALTPAQASDHSASGGLCGTAEFRQHAHCPDSGVFIGLSDWCCGCDGTGKDY